MLGTYYQDLWLKFFLPELVKANSDLTAAAAKSLQLCPTLCNTIDGSPPGSPVPGILQARTLEWVAISFSNAWKWKVKVKSLHHIRLLVTPWTAAHQAPLSMGFFRQGYWSGVPLPSLNSDLKSEWFPAPGSQSSSGLYRLERSAKSSRRAHKSPVRVSVSRGILICLC